MKVLRVCNEVADLAEHGVRAAPAMDGLLEEQGLGIQMSRILDKPFEFIEDYNTYKHFVGVKVISQI